MNTNRLKELLVDPTLCDLAQKYIGIPDADVKKKYSLLHDKLDATRFVLPVVGVQGSGKSTLLNAMAFSHPVLPVNADETTCVPVEIVYAVEPSRQATVVFKGDDTRRVIATEEALSEFVDNTRNPGNQLNVDRVIVESDMPALRAGMVLVDLPGVLSLTPKNTETTLQYINEAVGAIYLLRTVPPLTRNESSTLGLLWAKLPSVLFAQNRWTDESDEEVAEGAKHNAWVLRDMAKRLHSPMDGDPKIEIINAYQALRGTLSGDNADLTRSRLSQFVDALLQIAEGWPAKLENNIAGVLTADLLACGQDIESRQADLLKTVEQIHAEMEAEEKRFNGYLAAANDKTHQGTSKANAELRQIERRISEWVERTLPSLRNTMRTKMRAGIVDGPRLDRALRDEEQWVAEEIFSDVQNEVVGLSAELSEEFKDIPAWKGAKTEVTTEVGAPKGTKFEYLAPPLLSALGGIGGFMLGGAELGAAIGSVVPVAGTFIGSIVGSLIAGFLGAWSGRKAREGVTVLRAGKVEEAVSQAIEQFVHAVEDDLKSQLQSYGHSLQDAIDEWLRSQRRQFEQEQERILEDLRARKADRTGRSAELEQDLRLIVGWLDECKEAL